MSLSRIGYLQLVLLGYRYIYTSIGSIKLSDKSARLIVESDGSIGLTGRDGSIWVLIVGYGAELWKPLLIWDNRTLERNRIISVSARSHRIIAGHLDCIQKEII